MVDAPEEVVILLVGHLHGHLLALLLHLLLAVCPLHGGALRAAGHAAHGAPLLVTLLRPGRHLLLLDHGREIGLGSVVITAINLHLFLHKMVHQLAVLPCDVFTVIVASPDLLSVLVDVPLGVALLLGDRLTVRGLLDLRQNLDPIFRAFFRREGLLLRGVDPHRLLGLAGVAGVARRQGALRLGDGDADLLRPGCAFPDHMEAANLVSDCLVGQPVFGDIDTLVMTMGGCLENIGTIDRLLEAQRLACEGNKKDLCKHVSCSKESI